jgi:hypothetical protein
MLKSKGMTESEKYLAKLCEKSFLSLWSYPNVYSDEGKKGNGDGKEICDLLVVFGNDVIIFSDKSCKFSPGDINIGWNRWFKKSIYKSARQIYGAENWLLKYPNRVFLDNKCTTKLPIELPKPENIRIHRVLVALNVAKHVKKYFNSISGSLMINPQIVGNEHYTDNRTPSPLFNVGKIIPGKGYLHVFDDSSLDIVMNELDTISDFVEYLRKKEKFIRLNKLGNAASEEDLMAYYLREQDFKGAREFFFKPFINQPTMICADEGLWNEFKNHPQFIERKKADKVSYFWDSLIEMFNEYYFKGELNFENEMSRSQYEETIRQFAKQNRISRRYFSIAFTEFMRSFPNINENFRAFRVAPSPFFTNEAFAILLLSKPKEITNNEYKAVRKDMLVTHVNSALVNYPYIEKMMAIATEPPHSGDYSHDMLYIERKELSESDMQEAKKIQSETGFFLPENITFSHGEVVEYPEVT